MGRVMGLAATVLLVLTVSCGSPRSSVTGDDRVGDDGAATGETSETVGAATPEATDGPSVADPTPGERSPSTPSGPVDPIGPPAPPAPPTTTTPTPAPPSPAPQPSGFASISLLVQSPGGGVLLPCVLLAESSAQRMQGLMGVTGLGRWAGMIFVFPADTTGAFWMRNTLIPLSIAWYAADGSWVGASDMEPCPPDAFSCPRYGPPGPYRFAVEVPQGNLPRWGMVSGSTLVRGGSC